jgi:hypothetical protein
MGLNHIKLFEAFSDSPDNMLDRLKAKYPNAEITFRPNEKFDGRYFARVDIIRQDGEKEYLGALKGPVTMEDAMEFFETILDKNYDKFY